MKAETTTSVTFVFIESGNEICIYIESSMPDDLNPEEAVEELLVWMHEDEDSANPVCDVLESARARGYFR